VIAIGIDPGVETGFAVWNVARKQFISIESMKIHKAMQRVKDIQLTANEFSRLAIVIVEDARKRRVFTVADKNQEKYGAGVREGVGSAKRDAKIWDDYLTELGVLFVMNTPRTGKAKKDAALFKMLTKWEGRTNEHMRDAAMLVAGIDESHVKMALRFNQTK
jgi:hypothetical protein